MKKILITGAGGREYAIAKTILRKHPKTQFYFWQGNGGTADLGQNLQHIETIEGLLAFATTHKIDLTIVGSEDLLMQGIVDKFQQAKLPILGPHKRAARLEGDKAYAKKLMKQYDIKTAQYEVFDNPTQAICFLEENPIFPIVIKANGLAAGKGVFIVHSLAVAKTVIKQLMVDRIFNTAGDTILIEEFLEGFEVSVLSLYNGKEFFPFLSAKDHKRALDGDQGKNTGGMGVIAPHPNVSASWWRDFERDVLLPTQRAFSMENLQFGGVVFFGLMTTPKGVYLLEYNVRLGDPETQALLPLLESDLLMHFEDVLEGRSTNMKWSNKHACCVVIASKGYPDTYTLGSPIRGLENLNCDYFLAGVRQENDELLNAGGRVINVVACGESLTSAREKVYAEIKKIDFKEAYYRTDIGKM